MTRKVTIVGDGGNSAHLPDHSLESCMAAYTAGADGLLLTVQKTSDGFFLLYRHDDLSEATAGQGHIEQKTIEQISQIDAGAKFQIGKDFPWIRNSAHTFLRLGQLENLLCALEDNVRYFIRPSTSRIDISDRLNLMDEIYVLFAKTNRVSPVAVIEATQLAEVRGRFGDEVEIAAQQDNALLNDELTALGDQPPHYVFTKTEQYSALKAVLNEASSKCILQLMPGEQSSDLPGLVAGKDVTAIYEASGNVVTGETENWTDGKPDTNRWTLGVSSGHHVTHSMVGGVESIEAGDDDSLTIHRSWLLDNPFPASVTTGDGLHIAVVEGRTYASAGAVSRFSLGATFTVDVDFTYDNPQVSNMMVLAVINQEVWPSYFQKPGVQENINPMNQNHVFDTHGAAPFVSMEREEDDGFRIMKYTSTGGVYEWYGRFYLGNIGNPNSLAGKLRLERRGRFFTGYYQDENNADWVGVGTMENASMNDRVYLRLGAKHYPKGGGPDVLFPLNASYKNLTTLRPAGPVVQARTASGLGDLGVRLRGERS